MGAPKTRDVACSECRQPLIETRFTAGIVRVCDNYKCSLFRQPQKGFKPKTWQPSYRRWLLKRHKKRQERYQLARRLGIGIYAACKLRDRTLTDIEEFAKHDN